jgi:TolA-binding protein
MALSPKSTATIYAQTGKARSTAGLKEGDPFDPNVPGTIKLQAYPGRNVQIYPPNGYKTVGIKGDISAETALDDGRFSIMVPMELGPIPEKTLIDEEPAGEDRKMSPLYISGNDNVIIGFKYKGPDGNEQWISRTVHLMSDPFFDVMDRRYQDEVEGLHVGEKLYFRVIHKSMDTSDDKDTVKVELKTSSGKSVTLPLSETLGHSGIFKGVIDVLYDESKPGGPAASQPADKDGVPSAILVRYGDKITATYTPGGVSPLVRNIDVYMGADGAMTPFTKRFKDPNIAVQTQFTIAEAYFELAKKYRDLNQDTLSRRVIAQGKKLLEESIRDYPDTEFRAQADYLLANLDSEFAKDATNEDVKKNFQRSAITRFSNIVSSYPDNPYAPKAQYKKALILEQMGQMDDAFEEYIKLSYRYPDNELVAETIVRLGQYFLNNGKAQEDKAAEATDLVTREKIKIQARDLFRTGGQVFGRLADRFPGHRSATRATVQSAVCFLRAQDYDKAIEIFKHVIDDPKSDKESAAYSMYWTADTYMKKKDLLSAYRMFKKLTWDFPESQYAKFARGRLTEEELVKTGEADDAAGTK